VSRCLSVDCSAMVCGVEHSGGAEQDFLVREVCSVTGYVMVCSALVWSTQTVGLVQSSVFW
jgi:hypothetical protein